MKLGSKTGKKKAAASASLGKRSFIGVDISNRSVKMVQISGRGMDSVRIENCISAPLPANTIADGRVQSPEQLVATLQQMTTRLSAGAKNVVGCVPSGLSTLQSFLYDPANNMDLEQSAEFEAAQISVIDDINFDFHPLPKVSGDQEVLLAIAKKEDIQPRVDALENAGLPPAFMDTEGSARINAFSYWINTQSPDLEKSVLAVMDIGEDHAQVQVIQGGRQLFWQECPIGGRHLTLDIQRTYQIEQEEAEHMKIGQNKPADYASSVAEIFNARIAQELQRALQFYYTMGIGGGDRKVERILLTGGTSQVEGMAENVSNSLGIPVQIIHPSETVPSAGKVSQGQMAQNASRYTVAFGLALRGLA